MSDEKTPEELAKEYAYGLRRVEPARFTRSDIEFAHYSGHRQTLDLIRDQIKEHGYNMPAGDLLKVLSEKVK